MLATLLMLLAGSGCQPQPPEHRGTFLVFGTLVEVTVRGVADARADTAFEALRADFERMHRDWHPWEPGALTRLNDGLKRGECVAVPDSIRTLIRRSVELERITDGRFNPAIGGLIELWGFHTSQFPITGPPPAESAIRALVAQQPSMGDLELQADCVAGSNPAVQLDFSGNAKGYAVDLAVQRLRGMDVPAALVNAGGDLRAYGRTRDGWRVGVRDPDEDAVLATVGITGDSAVFTSGVDQRYRIDAEKRYPHIIDPRTGYPVDHIASATVIADAGLHADAAVTALVVAGPGEWPEVATAVGLDQVLMVLGDGSLELTPAMRDRLQDGPWQDRDYRVVQLPRSQAPAHSPELNHSAWSKP